MTHGLHNPKEVSAYSLSNKELRATEVLYADSENNIGMFTIGD